ncbi:hypothetical protein GQ53DRAFT_811238 [Thozetella sp. PMI_491]|nr:hypothetical protein GQ53DRAFT_811238 [Thozetella sp. PMI_491]
MHFSSPSTPGAHAVAVAAMSRKPSSWRLATDVCQAELIPKSGFRFLCRTCDTSLPKQESWGEHIETPKHHDSFESRGSVAHSIRQRLDSASAWLQSKLALVKTGPGVAEFDLDASAPLAGWSATKMLGHMKKTFQEARRKRKLRKRYGKLTGDEASDIFQRATPAGRLRTPEERDYAAEYSSQRWTEEYLYNVGVPMSMMVASMGVCSGTAGLNCHC